jgi:hypothetical protein
LRVKGKIFAVFIAPLKCCFAAKIAGQPTPLLVMLEASYPIEGGLDEFNYAIALWDDLPYRLACRTRRGLYRLAFPPSLFRSFFPTRNF